jgi:hypothetical protein
MTYTPDGERLLVVHNVVDEEPAITVGRELVPGVRRTGVKTDTAVTPSRRAYNYDCI